MNFLKRIGYGWLLISESFFSIFNQHTNLIKIAALICALLIVLFVMASVPVLASSMVLIALGGIAIFIVSILLYIIQAALYYYFNVFLQEGRRLTLEAAIDAITPKAGYILLWLLLDNTVYSLFIYILGASSWWKILSSIGVRNNTYPLTALSLIGSLLQLFWAWLSFFVLASIVLDNTGIIEALRTSALLALKKIPEFIGFLLWNIVGIWPLGLAGLTLSFYVQHVPWFFKIPILYCIALFFIILYFTYALFTVALYLSSTGRSVSGFSPRLQDYFAQQSQHTTTPVLRE